MPEWSLPEINPALCNCCGACIERCPNAAVEMRADRPFFVRPMACTYCGLCETACPTGAIALHYEIVWMEPSQE
ncbi:MAG: 4Fe-4S dicluster domain-containing protein [Chloroflexi bacterium]|nr:4Fe-4S dicluster domain-containing protein [Chloroflexota bacterium]